MVSHWKAHGCRRTGCKYELKEKKSEEDVLNQEGEAARDHGRSGPRVVCVGACHIDRKARAAARLTKAASNPATVERSFGGVARNVAENLCRLGAEVDLVSRLGEDGDGRSVREFMSGLPLGLGSVGTSLSAPTAFHLIVLESDGEMHVAVADMRVYDELTPAALASLPAALWQADAIFADCNLPQESLDWLARRAGPDCALAVNGVSPAKAVRAKICLPSAAFLFVNRGEAAALTGCDPDSLEPDQAAQALRAAGAREVVITLGAEGLVVAGDGPPRHLAKRPGPLQDVTGAGDALAAAFLDARLRGLDPAAAAERALAAACLTVQSPQSVHPELSRERLERMTS